MSLNFAQGKGSIFFKTHHSLSVMVTNFKQKQYLIQQESHAFIDNLRYNEPFSDMQTPLVFY